MGTLSHLLDEVAKLSKDSLRAGADPKKRKVEFRLLAKLVPRRRFEGATVRRGCILENGIRKVRVRVFNGRIHDLAIFRSGGTEIVEHDGIELPLTTTEEFKAYIVGLCSAPHAKRPAHD